MKLNFLLYYSLIKWILLFFCAFGSLTFYAQSEKQIDSILKLGSAAIYKNPEGVIKEAKKLLSSSQSDINLKIKANKLISDAYSSMRDYEKSLDYVIRASNLLKYSNDELLKILIITKTAILYHQLKIYDKSIQQLDLAEKLINHYPIKDSIYSSLGRNYIVRGFIYKEKLSCDIAVNFFDRGIKELSKSKIMADNAPMSIAKYNSGNCQFSNSKYALAIQSYKEAIQYAKNINAKSLQAFALKGLAKVYTTEGNYTEAIALLEEAVKMSEDVNDLILNQELYKGLSENYLAVNEWEKFRIFHKKLLILQKQINDNERNTISKSLKNKELEINQKKEKEDYYFYGWMALIFIGSFSVIIIFILLIRRKRKEFTQLNEEIKILQSKKPF